MMGSIRNILRDRRGAVAATFVLMLPVMLAGMALAIDYSTFRVTHTRMQTAADAAALAAIDDLTLDDAAKVQKALDMIGQNVPEDYGDMTKASDVTLGTFTKEGVFTPAAGADVNAVRVAAVRSVARGNEVNRIFSMFISKEALTISTVAIAARPTNVAFEPPDVITFQGGVASFNEIYAYCYDPVNKVRREETMGLIGNNNNRGKNTTTGYPLNPDSAKSLQVPSLDNWPNCKEPGDTVSLRLRHFLNANSKPNEIWTGHAERNYYTDTSLVNGVQTSDLFGPGKMIETILCPSQSLCTPSQPGDPNPTMVVTKEAMKITPKVETKPCTPGSFMYYGFENRNPADKKPDPNAGSDQDYEDISLVLRCPSAGKLGGGKPRLVG